MSGVLRWLFVLYCLEAGVFLAVLPWTSGWDSSVLQLAGGRFLVLVLHPVARGAVTAFGLTHLLWGAHDVELWLVSRRG